MNLDGAVAAVFGASSGLGRRLAIDMASRGAVVVGMARRVDLLEVLTDELRLHSPASEHVVCDMAESGRATVALNQIEERHGRIDVLVNAAAFEQRTAVEARDMDLYRASFEVNFFGAVEGTLAVLPGMLRRRHGVVVNVSSDHGRAPAPGTPAYSASKAALSAFTESVAHEVADRGVRLHVLYPGWVPTALGQGAVDQGMPLPPRAVRRSEQQVSDLVMRRMGGPRIEMNASRLATLAPVLRALAPRLYQSQMRRQH